MNVALVLLVLLPVCVTCFYLSDNKDELTSFDGDELASIVPRHKRSLVSRDSSSSERSIERIFRRNRSRSFSGRTLESWWLHLSIRNRLTPTARPSTRARPSFPTTTATSIQNVIQDIVETESHSHSLSNGGTEHEHNVQIQ